MSRRFIFRRIVGGAAGLATSLFCIYLPCGLDAQTSELQAAPDWSAWLEGLWQQAEQRSPGFRSLQRSEAASQARSDAIPRWWRPDVDGELGGGVAANAARSEGGPLARLSARWVLWDGGLRDAQRRQEQAEIGATRAQAELRRIDLRLRIAASAAGAWQKREQALAFQLRGAQALRLSRLLAPRVRIGTAAPGEIAEMQQIARTAQLEQDQAEREAIWHLRELTTQCGSELELALPAAAPAWPALPLREIKLEETAFGRYLEAAAQSAQAASDRQHAEHFAPQAALELYGGWGPFRDALDRQRPELGLQLGLRVPLLRSADGDALHRSHEAQRDSRLLALEQERLEAQLSLQKLEQQRLALHEAFATWSELATTNRSLLLQADREFSRGLRNAADLAAAQDRALEGQIKWLELRRQLILLDLEYDLLIQSIRPTAGAE